MTKLVIVFILLGAGFFYWHDLSPPNQQTSVIAQTKNEGRVLAAETSIDGLSFDVIIPATFGEDVTFEKDVLIKGSLIAPNLLQGVTSLQGETGALSLVAGTGITIDGLKITNSGITSLSAGSGISVSGSEITNSDKGSSQNIFKTFSVSGQSDVVADANSDTFTFAAGTGVTLITDATNGKLTISASGSDPGWTDGGTSVYLTTSTDNVGIGTSSPSYKLEVTGTSFVSDTLTAGGAFAVTGVTNLNGNVILGDATSDTISFTGRLTNGTSIIPDTDLGSDLGSTSFRFNNLWVANINSNASQSFSGQTTFSYAPTDSTITTASVIINPTTATADGQLLAFGIAGFQRALVDEDGDLIIGYNDATSAPASDYPFNVYGHSGTRVSYIDTLGNIVIAGGITASGLTTDGVVTVSTGVLSAEAQLAVARGGTNLSTIAAGSVLAANTLDTLSAITSTSGLKVLQNSNGVVSWASTTGTGNAVFSDSPTFTSANFTGTIGISGAAANAARGVSTDFTNESAISYGLYNTLNTGSFDVYGTYNSFTLDISGRSGYGLNNIFANTIVNSRSYGVNNEFGSNSGNNSLGRGLVNTGTFSGNFVNFIGLQNNAIFVTGTDAKSYGVHNTLVAGAGATSQTLYGAYTELYTYSGASDVGYYYYAKSDAAGGSTGGTQYGLYVDLADTSVTNYSIYVQPGSGISYFGSNVGIGATVPASVLDIGSSDLGDGAAGPVITLGRNSNATNPGAGSINFLSKSGTAGYVWQDDAGVMRINTAAPTTANDLAGTVIGSQASALAFKDVLGEYTDYSDALSTILDTPLFNFNYKSGAFSSDKFVGIITDYSPAFGMDNGKALNVISGIGYSFAAIKELNTRITTLENRSEKENGIDMTVVGKLTAGGGLVVAQKAEFKEETIFESLVSFLGDIIFNGKVFFAQAPTFNKDTAGHAVIKSGQTQIRVLFEKEYEYEPIVNLTPRSLVKLDSYRVTEETTKGFTIEIQPMLSSDIEFNWSALAVKGAKTTESPLIVEPTPTASTSVMSTETITASPSATPSPTIVPIDQEPSATPSAE